MYRGFDIAAVVADEVPLDTRRGFVGGYYLEGLAIHLPYTAAFMKPGGWGRDFTSAMEMYDHMSCVWVCGEDLAREQNSITLHPTEKDQYGLPVPIVTKTYHANDDRITAHGLVQWRKLSEAVGATRVIDMPAYPASHNMGTNRMSAKASDGVVNKWGQAHDVKNLFISDGSQFTSSSAANPTLTIVALAIRQAEYIAGAMQRRELAEARHGAVLPTTPAAATRPEPGRRWCCCTACSAAPHSGTTSRRRCRLVRACWRWTCATTACRRMPTPWTTKA